jgi:hypothetical protein
VGLQHAHFWDKTLGFGGPFPGSKDKVLNKTRHQSKAWVNPQKRFMYPYLTAHIYGGDTRTFLHMLRTLREHAVNDFAQGEVGRFATTAICDQICTQVVLCAHSLIHTRFLINAPDFVGAGLSR